MRLRVITVVAFIVALGGSFSAGFMMNKVEIQEKEIFVDRVEYVDVPGELDPVFHEVMEDLLDNHYTAPTMEELWEGALFGMIDSLDDPYTVYWDYEEAASFQQSMGESYVGIGVSVRFTDGLVVVEEVRAGSPAEDGGMLVNDIIVSVDGETTLGEGLYDTIGKIIGDEGTDVLVGVRRQGFDLEIPLLLTRAVINNPTVEYEVIVKSQARIGYIQVHKFGTETYTNFKIALNYLESSNIDRLIVDLRNNGGGQVSTVRWMLNEFLLDNGTPMFTTEGLYSGEFIETIYDSQTTEKKAYDIVTLVNQNSASASEVFASGMQEQGGYAVVGTVTFGKGTMQLTKSITTTVGDKLHITIGKWKTANGNWVNGTGVTPDVLAVMNEYETAYKVFLGEEVILFDTVDKRVENIQLILQIMGYTVRDDGYFDVNTQNAIKDIQTNNGLPSTGNIDSETMVFLNEALSAYQNNQDNDSQLQAAIDYFLNSND
jgi:carboxyl-terminal processing protease